MIRISHRLEPFVSNKRVAIVGGADHMVGTNLGSKIDSYDTVVRVNLHWPSPRAFGCKKDFTKDIGCRTDVIIVTEAIWDLKCAHFTDDLKYAVLIGQTYDTNLNSMIRTFSAMDVDFDLMLGQEAAKIIEGVPSTGFIAMKLVLDANPSELFVSGYDFFTQSTRGWKTHNPVAELEYFRDKIITQDRVTSHVITENSCYSYSSLEGMNWRKQKFQEIKL